MRAWTFILTTTIAICLQVNLAEAQQTKQKRLQYGFAHRANDWDVIKDVLDAGSGGGNVAGNGIECDIGYSTYYKDWIVSHDNFGIAQPASEYLHEWLKELKKQLDTGKYNQTFAALWIDIKTPNADDLAKVVQLVRKNVPSSVAVIYDLGGKENFGIGSGNTKGYKRIKNSLRTNEGIGIWLGQGEVAQVQKVYELFKRDKITRTVVHHGHSANIDEKVLTEINNSKYHNPRDPYRFKKVFTWTNDKQSTMAKYINPNNTYSTDGQIVGAFGVEWYGYYGELEDFQNAVNQYSTTEKLANRSVNDFWE